MQKSRSMILGLALVLAVPAAVLAQSQERTTTSGDARNVTCRVTNLNSGEKSFTADCPEGQMTFTTTSSTQFTRSTSGATGGGASASMSDLKVGDQVRVTYSGQAAGTGTTGGTGMKQTATRVEIMPSGTASPSGAQSGSPSGGTQSASQSGSQSGSQYGSQPASQPASQTGGQYGSQQQGNRVQGRVASVDRQNRTLVIETDKGRETFKVEQGNTSVDFNSIREGEHVEIAFSGTGTDRRITSLRMVPESMAQQQRPGAGEQPASQRTGTQQPAEQRASQQTGTQRAGQQTGQQNRVTGRVVSVDDKKLVIETSRGRETFQVDPASTTVELNRFKQGDQVTVMYAGTGNEKRITSIQAAAESRASQRGAADEDVEPAGQRLPQTASEIPFIGLVGLFMLAAAFGLRYVRRHV
jgi:hypothetical protein